jgi:ribonuclease P protein component
MPSVKSPGIRWAADTRDIKSIKSGGLLFRGRSVLVWVSHNACEGTEVPVVGIAPARGFTSAVNRNLAKRRIRGCLLELRHLLKPGTGYLVQFRPGVEKQEYQILVEEIRSILLRA